MNLKSQQLRSDLSLEIDTDQVLKPNEIKEVLLRSLGKENCFEEVIEGKKVFVYRDKHGRNQVLLFANVTYLGGDGAHPTFKKRIQLKPFFKSVALSLSSNLNYFVRFIGVYHYKGNIVFVDFIKDTYMKKKMHNSAAHVYINDLYQGMKNGIFRKIDRNNNLLYCIRFTKFSDYLNNDFAKQNKMSRISIYLPNSIVDSRLENGFMLLGVLRRCDRKPGPNGHKQSGLDGI